MGQNFSESPGNIVAAFSSVLAPTAGDDAGDGFVIGSTWVHTTTNVVYTCTDTTLGAAIWVPATAIRETGGPTVLTIGAVTDGQFLRRVGNLLIGGSAPSQSPRYGVVSSPGGTTAAFNTVYLINTIGSDAEVILPTLPNFITAGSVIIVKRGTGSADAVIIRTPSDGRVHSLDGVVGKSIYLLEPEETATIILSSGEPSPSIGPVTWETLAIDSYSHNRNTYLTASLGSPMEFGKQYVFDMATATANLTASLPAITANNIGKKISVKRVNSGAANVFNVVVNRNGTDLIDYVNTASRTIDGDDAHLIFESSINGLVNSWIVE